MVQLVNYLAAMQDTWVQFLGWEDSPGEGNSYPLQYSGLENSMDCMYSPWGCNELDTIERLSLSLNGTSTKPLWTHIKATTWNITFRDDYSSEVAISLGGEK